MVVAFKKFYKRHFANNIENFLLEELNKLNIGEKIISITTDSGRDIQKAATNLKTTYPDIVRLSCTAHNINLVVKHSFSLWKSKKPESQPESEDEVEYVDEYVDEDDLDDGNDSLSSSDDDDDDFEFDHNFSDENNFEGVITKLLSKVRRIVRLYKKSSLIFCYFKNYISKLNSQLDKGDKLKGTKFVKKKDF